MKFLFCIFALVFVQTTLAGSLSVKMNVPQGVIVKRLYAKYERGGLDWCGRSPEILGNHTIKAGILTGHVKFKNTIRDQGCRKTISHVAVAFEVYQENGNFLNFMGNLYENPFGPKARGQFEVIVPISTAASAQNIKNVTVKCEREYIFNNPDWNYLNDSCSTNKIPAIGSEANSAIEIVNLKAIWPSPYQGALSHTFSFPELGFDIELFLNKKGIIGELSLMRILPTGGPVSPAYPVGDHIVTHAETKNGLYVTTETWLKKENMGARMFFMGYRYKGGKLKPCTQEYCNNSVLTLFKIEKNLMKRYEYIE